MEHLARGRYGVMVAHAAVRRSLVRARQLPHSSVAMVLSGVGSVAAW